MKILKAKFIILCNESLDILENSAIAFSDKIEKIAKFDELINILECLGEIHDRPIVIYIDAVNESNYRDIWKNGLSTIYNRIKNLNYVRVAVSVRSGYEPFVFDNNILDFFFVYQVSYLNTLRPK